MRKVRFLDHLAAKGDVRAACARVGMSRTSAYLLRRRDGAFARGWAAALVLARRYVEEVLATRALDGVEEAVWFRGELVGTKRRYDARLLLAHLGRLDRQAEVLEDAGAERGGGDDAERFNELLALVAGERPGPDLCAPDAAPDALPPDRADYVEESARSAYVDANEAWLDTVEAIDAAFDEEHGFVPGEGIGDAEGAVPLPDYPSAPVFAQFQAASIARWDGWQARAFGRVDALLAGEIEVKSAFGAGEFAALDCVNRVNLQAGGSPFSSRFVGQWARPGAGCAGSGTPGRVRGYGM
jgi:hypothetical protein